MKKVLSIILPPTFGGPHNQILRLNESLKKRGYEYYVLTPESEDSNSGYQVFLRNGVNVIGLDLKRPRKTLKIIDNILFFTSLRQSIRQIQKIIQNENISVVQLCGLVNIQGMMAAKREDTPIVWQLLGNFWPGIIRRLLSPVVNKYADVVMTTGGVTAQEHSAVLEKNRTNSLFHFYPPVDTREFSIKSVKSPNIIEHLKLRGNSIVIGTIGNQNLVKGHDIFAKIAQKCKEMEINVQFRIVGNHTASHKEGYQKNVYELAKDLNLFENDFFSIVKPEHKISEYLGAFDIFLLTSYKEGVPTVILEAMACGLPVISSNVGSVSEIVKDGRNGFLFEINEYQKVTGIIRDLVHNTCLYKEISENNRKIAVEKYDVDKCAEKHIKCFELASAIKNK